MEVEEKLKQYCSFYINEQLYGIDIMQVKEINVETNFTDIEHTCEKIEGHVNIRGQIYVILNLRIILGYEYKKVDDIARIALFKPETGESFGILIDKFKEVIEVREKDFCPDDEAKDKKNMSDADILTTGSYQLQNELLTIIDASKILPIMKNNEK